MASDNVITITGNLADDPELRFTPNGVAVTSVRVAVNQRRFNRETNSWDEKLDGSQLNELERQLRLADEVVRHKVVQPAARVRNP